MDALTRPSKVGHWSEPALRVLRERYLIRRDGEVTETPDEMCWRVALAIARAEPDRVRVIDATRPLEVVQQDILDAVATVLKGRCL